MPSASEIQDVPGVGGAGPKAGRAAPTPQDGEHHGKGTAWNRTDAELPADRRIHQLFAARATPDAPAVLSAQEALTNEALDRLPGAELEKGAVR